MRTVSRRLLVLALAVLMTSPLVAGDKKEKGKHSKHKGRKGHHATLLRLPPSIQLTAEQKEKVAALRKQFGPKVAALRKKRLAILTPEQRKAQHDAIRKAKASGAKGKELYKAIRDATSLSEDQKQQMQSLRKEMHALRGQIRDSLKKILTAEQQSQLKSHHGQKRRGQGRKKKRPAAE